MASDIHVKEDWYSDFNDLYYNRCWFGAKDTLEDIKNAGVEDEFMDYLTEVFLDEEVVDMGELNDFIWFERDSIYEACGLDENGELIVEEDEEDEEVY